jgi:hypothetical protein
VTTSPRLAVPLLAKPRWVSARPHPAFAFGYEHSEGGYRIGDVVLGHRANWAVLDVRALTKPRSRRGYTHRLLFGPITNETAKRLKAQGGRELWWSWDRKGRAA